jgi:hypothetical protein
MVIQSTGNGTPFIGIGTVSPGSNFDLRGTMFVNNRVIIGPNANKRSLLTVKGTSFTDSGTVSVSSSSTTVTGTNTFFLSQVGPGDFIQLGSPVNDTRTVVDVIDNATLVVNTPFASSGSGITMTTVPALIRADDTTGNPFFIVKGGTTNFVGIGTLQPTQALEVNGGVRLNTALSKPTCDPSSRGTFWITQGGAGVKDAVEVCAKDASDSFAWRAVY